MNKLPQPIIDKLNELVALVGECNNYNFQVSVDAAGRQYRLDLSDNNRNSSSMSAFVPAK